MSTTIFPKSYEEATSVIRLTFDTSVGSNTPHCRPSEGDNGRTVNKGERSANSQNTVTTRMDEGGSSNEATSSSTFGLRLCAGSCGQPIPAKRLLARPNATMCVPCQEAAGDVIPIRRFDEYSADGTRIETYFGQDQANPLLSAYMRRGNTAVPDDLSFDIAVGDDSHLVREGNRVMDAARPLSEEFEDVGASDLEPLVKPQNAGEPRHLLLEAA